MAKNVTVQGASYEDVPAVELPQTGGGTALFTDTSDSTLESANELVSGVTAYDRSGNLLTGTADYMDLVSNPTANDVLVTDANGQAQDSGVQLSTLSGKQDALTAGTGINITNDGTISNTFLSLNSPDLNDIDYNFQGYVLNADSTPTDAKNAYGQLCVFARAGGSYCWQIFHSYNDDKFFIRYNDNGTWSDWQTLILSGGGTMTSTLKFENTTGDGAYFYATDLDATTAVPSNFSGAGIRLRDKNGWDVGAINHTGYSASDTIGMSLIGSRRINNAQTYNGVRLLVKNDGTPLVSLVGTNADVAWRTAIGAQQTLTAGTGILFNGNQITNKFAYLPSPNLDEVDYYYQGYATSPKYTQPNSTTTTFASGYLSVYPASTSGANFCCQIFSPYNSDKVIMRKKNNGTWGEWIELINSSGGAMDGKLTLNGLAFSGGLTATSNAPYFLTLNQSYASGGNVGYVIKANMLKAIGGTYEAGDTISYDAQIVSAGYITSSTKELRFNIPVSKPINASGISFSKLTVAMYNDSGTKMSATQVAGTTGYTLTNSSVGVNHIYVRLGLPSAPSGVTNNTSCTIVVTALTATFS